MAVALDVAQWAEEQFGACEFGDRRRTKRMVKLATQVATKPDASTPKQTERWADCKAAYRLFDQPDVTFDAVIAPHCALSRNVGPGVWLIINDTTEISFGDTRKLSGVGRVGPGDAQGFYLHTAMVVSADRDELVGLAAQELYARPLEKTPRVSSARRKKLACETDIWGRVIDQVSQPPAGARYVHVCDRGADNFDVYCHLLHNHAGWVIRAAQLTRVVHDADGRERSLDQVICRQPVLGTYDIEIRGNKDQPARTASMEVCCAEISMPRPKAGVSHFARESGVSTIRMWAVEVRETDPPRGVEALRWVLLTSEEVERFGDAWRVVEWYEKRPLIEEYHKCLKTGCRVDTRQYQTGERLGPVIGLLSVLAIRLLQLKMVAREQPQCPAANVVPTEWLAALPQLTKQRKPIQSVRDFFRALAGLGGFLGRKGDGEPGWQTIWHGLETLLLCLRGAELLKKRCG